MKVPASFDSFLSLLCLGGWTTAAAIGVGAAVAEPISASIMAGVAIWRHFADDRRSRCELAFKRVRQQAEKEFAKQAKEKGWHPDQVTEAFSEFDRLFAKVAPKMEDLVAWRLDPDKVADGLLARMAPESRRLAEDAVARKIVSSLIGDTVLAVRDDPFFYAKVEPVIARETLESLDLLHIKLDHISEDAAATRAGVDEILALLKAQGGLARAEAAGLNDRQIVAILEAFGATEAPAEQAEATLLKKAAELRQLEGRLAAFSNEDPRLRPYRDRARAALADGRFDDAADELAEAETVIDESLDELQGLIDQRRREKSRLREGQANAKQLGLAYGDAARLFREAADLLPVGDHEDWARLRDAEASAHRAYADIHPGLEALAAAIEAYEAALTIRTKDALPAQWAATQNNKAIAFQVLGLRQGGEAGLQSLRAAAAAVDAALTVHTKDAMPAEWSTAQSSKGNVLLTLGDLQGADLGLETLHAAVAAYDAALTVQTKEAMPTDWAMTQNNKAIALRALGERQVGAVGLQSLRAAIAAFDAALTVFTKAAKPARWGAIQNNKAIALVISGQRQGGEAGLETLHAAVAAYDAALTVRNRETTPVDWAMTQGNKGNVLGALGQRLDGEDGLRSLSAAVAAHDAALTVFTADATPAHWAGSQNNKGSVLQALGERQDVEAGLQSLRDAVVAYDAALTIRTEQAMPFDWAATQNNRGNALRTLGERLDGEERAQLLSAAVAACEGALTVFTKEAMPVQWAIAKENVAEAKLASANLSSESDLNGALDAIDAALSVYRDGGMDFHADRVERVRADILAMMGEGETKRG